MSDDALPYSADEIVSLRAMSRAGSQWGPMHMRRAVATIDALRAELAAEREKALQAYDDTGTTWADRAEKAEAEVARLTAELKRAQDWETVDDEWTYAINAAHPTRGGSHDTYGTAMQMVSHRHSKGSLIALVNWLLTDRDRLAADLDRRARRR